MLTRAFSLSLLFLVPFALSAQVEPPELKNLDVKVKSLMEQYKANGVSLAVVRDNEIIYSKGFGFRDVDNGLLVTKETIFPIGSITKSFTASLLGILEGQGVLSLSDKPAHYLPSFSFYNDKMNNLITIDDLLSHKSGLGNQGASEIFFPEKDLLVASQRLRFLKPQGEIKNSFIYSNCGYTVAGSIVEQVTGESWEENLDKYIFQQLGMNDSFTSYKRLLERENYSMPYGLYKGTSEKVKFERFNSTRPAGAIKSNVVDLAKWMKVWLNNGRLGDVQVIPGDYVQEAMRIQNAKNDTYESDAFLQADGFGWRLRSSYGHFRVDHGGNTFGFSTALAMFPFDKIGIVVLSNQDNSILPHLIVDHITRLLFKLDEHNDYPFSVKEIYKPKARTFALNKSKPPTHPFENYSGDYEAKGYGKVKVIMKDKMLYMELPKLSFYLEHLDFNSFYLKPTSDFDDVYNPQFDLQFVVNTQGDITSFKLFAGIKPITFYKIDSVEN